LINRDFGSHYIGMVTLLRRLFIKDYQEVSRQEVRSAHGVLAAVFGMITNSILVALKLTAAILMAKNAGWVFSMALVGDAINNLSDLASSTVTLIGFILAKKPADKEHPYGHQRVEYVAGLIVAIFIVFAGVELLTQSISKVVSNTTVSYDVFALVILGVSIAIKGVQSYVNFSLAKTINSSALKATGVDSLTDSIATSVILISALLAYFQGWGFLDGYMGILVGLFVGFNGIKMIVEESNPLIGSPYAHEFKEQIQAIVARHKEIIAIHDLLCHSYGPTAQYVSFHAEVDERMGLKEAHELIDQVEEEIGEALRCNITIHIDPVAIDEPKTQKYKEEITKLLLEVEPKATFHDLRVKSSDSGDVVFVDIEVPFEKNKENEKKIEKALTGLGAEIRITFDHPFSE